MENVQEHELWPVKHKGVANPSPLGLAAFGLTTFVLSFYNAGIAVGYGAPPNAVVGVALFYGGLCQLLAGMWEFRAANTFGATTFSSFGGFWLSYAALLIPWFGVSDGYHAAGASAHVQGQAVAIFLMSFAILTFVLLLCALRQNIALIALLTFLILTLVLLSVANYRPNVQEHFTKAGGWFGIVTALIAFYMVLANLANKEDTFFTLPLGNLGPNRALKSSVASQ